MMASMTIEEVLRELLWRVGSEEARPLSGNQVCHWPEGLVPALEKAGWLKAMEPSTTVACPGCEDNCTEPVHVLPTDEGRPARAFVVCDQREDMGRVNIPLSLLSQWQITPTQVAHWVARKLGLKGKPERDPATGTFTLGSLQGKKRVAKLKLVVADPVSLQVSGHSLPLEEGIVWGDGAPDLDRGAILDLIDLPPVSDRDRYKPSIVKSEARKLETQAMHEGWQKAYPKLKKKYPGHPDTWYAGKIAKNKTLNPLGRNAETIRKHMKK